MAAELRKKKVVLSYHICGNATPIIAGMVESGAQMLEVDQKADQLTCKTAAKGRATLVGPVDPSGVLAKGTPEEVTDKCREAIQTLGGGGGFILGPGCAMPSTTPDENIDAMIEAARSFHY